MVGDSGMGAVPIPAVMAVASRECFSSAPIARPLWCFWIVGVSQNRFWSGGLMASALDSQLNEPRLCVVVAGHRSVELEGPT